jgi:hypothetical protein
MGGAGRGGGVDIEGGTVTISKSQIEFNSAQGGNGGARFSGISKPVDGSAGGGAAGGGIYVGGGTIHLTLDVIQSNGAYGGKATAGYGSQSQNNSGGGLYVVAGTVVTKDSFTLGDLVNNFDSNFDGNDNYGTGGPF